MAKLLKLRRGTTTQHGSFTGAEGEVTIDTTKDTAVVHDGSTAGGAPLLREDMSNLPAGTIDNADVNASAAIAGTKISPDFGSQDITTTGKIKFANVYNNESDLPSASTYHGMFAHVHSTGLAYYAHGGSWHKLAKNDAPEFTNGIDVTGTTTTEGLLITKTSGNVNATVISNDAYGTLEVGGQTGCFIDLKTPASDDYDLRVVSDGYIYAKSDINLSPQSGNVVNVVRNLNAQDGLDVTGNITVTGTVDGRDVAADGSKLDTYSSNGSNYLRSDVGDQANGDITFSGGAGAVTVSGGSDIRIAGGTWSGEYTGGIKLQPDASNSYFQYHGGLYFRKPNGSNALTLDSSGNLTATGNVTAYSDAKLKTDIHTINDALGIVGKLRGVSYKWIATDTPSIGVIAQEVEEVLPEVVLTNRETNPSTGETTEIKSVDYGKIVGVLINAINELKAEVDELKKPKKKGGK